MHKVTKKCVFILVFMHKDVTIKNIAFWKENDIMKKTAALLVLTMAVVFAGCGRNGRKQ